jgi:hypothetical protein
MQGEKLFHIAIYYSTEWNGRWLNRNVSIP